jgi:hypothetical protein
MIAFQASEDALRAAMSAKARYDALCAVDER